MTFRNQKCFTD